MVDDDRPLFPIGPPPVTAPQAPPRPRDVADHARALEVAIGAEGALGEAAAARAIDDAAAEGFVLDRLIERVTAPARARLYASAVLSWDRLARATAGGGDPVELARAMIAWRLANGATSTVAALFDASWCAAAAHEPRLLALSWRALGALSWHQPVVELGATLRAIEAAPAPAVAEAISRAQDDVRASTAMRSRRRALPDGLLRLLAADGVGDRSTCRELAARFRARIAASPAAVLAMFGDLATTARDLAAALATRFEDVPAHRRDASALAPEVVHELARPSPRSVISRAAGWLALGCVGAGIVCGLAGAKAAGLFGGLAMLLGILAVAPYLVPDQAARRHAVTIAIRGGITLDALAGWMRANPRTSHAGRLYLWLLRRNDGLRLTCAVSAWTAHLAERDDAEQPGTDAAR